MRRRLDALGVPYVLDPTLVRGLDYYSRTTFEFLGPDESANSSICGGGRYDGLVEQIGGPPTPGIGFGAGLARLLLAVESEGRTWAEPRLDAFVVVDGGDRVSAQVLVKDLRAAGLAADMDWAGRSLKGQLSHAGRTGAETLVVVGADVATIRRSGRPDEPVGLGEVVATLTA